MSHQPLPRDAAIPILPARNLEETIAFYTHLGFETVAQYPGYAILCRGAIELHVSHLPTLVPTESYAECYLRVANVDELFQTFTPLSLPNEGIPRLGPLEDKPWGMREFYIVDPSGNLLRIGQTNS